MPFSSLSYANDYEIKELSWIPGVPKGNSDKYRTAAFQFNVLEQGFGFNLMTGDPGEPIRDEEGNIIIDNRDNGYYTDKGTGDPDKYRLGVLYVKTGPLRLGWNSEGIRDYIQNKKIHKWTGDPYFNKLSVNKFFWYFGTGTGFSLW